MAKKKAIRLTTATLLTSATVAVVGATLYFWLRQGKPNEISKYCNNIHVGTHYDEVLRSAKSKGFVIPFYAKEPDRLTIFNKNGSLFKSGCSVQFVDDYVVRVTLFGKR